MYYRDRTCTFHYAAVRNCVLYDPVCAYYIQNAATSRDQVVTATEKEHVMSGNLDRLVEEQRRLDDERDREARHCIA